MMTTENKVPVNYTAGDLQPEFEIDPAEVIATDQAECCNSGTDGGVVWKEPATLPDGRDCLKVYSFSEDEELEAGEHADNLPWDDDHVIRIEIDE